MAIMKESSNEKEICQTLSHPNLTHQRELSQSDRFLGQLQQCMANVSESWITTTHIDSSMTIYINKLWLLKEHDCVLL